MLGVFLLKKGYSGLHLFKRVGDMSGLPSLRWIGVFGQFEYVVPCNLGIITIFRLGFGFTLLSVWPAFWVI